MPFKEQLEALEARITTAPDHWAPGDHLDLALAAITVALAADWSLATEKSRVAEYSALQEKVEAAITRLRVEVPTGTHQAHARAYAELARLADALGLPRRRARAERELERNRPMFNQDEAVVDALALLLPDESLGRRQPRTRASSEVAVG